MRHFLDVTLFKDIVNMPSNYIWIRLNEWIGVANWKYIPSQGITRSYGVAPLKHLILRFICIKTERLKPDIRWYIKISLFQKNKTGSAYNNELYIVSSVRTVCKRLQNAYGLQDRQFEPFHSRFTWRQVF